MYPPLAAGLEANTSLTRLALTSVGMSDDGAITISNALEQYSNIATLDIGQSYATEDLHTRYVLPHKATAISSTY